MSCDNVSNQRILLPCQEHGTCVGSQCICNDLWTGIGDFSVIDGLFCGLYKNAIVGLSFGSIIINLITFLIISRIILLRSRLFSLMHINRRNVQLKLLVLVCNLLTIVFSALKIIDQDKYAVGKSLIYTILYSCIAATVMVPFIIHLEINVKFIDGYYIFLNHADRMAYESYFRYGNYKIIHFINALYPIILLTALIPSIGMAMTSEYTYYIAGMLFYLLWAVFLIVLYPIAYKVFSVVKGQIDIALTTNIFVDLTERKRLLNVSGATGRMILFLRFVLPGLIFVTVICGGFAIALRLSVYLNLIIHITTPLAQIPIVYSVSNDFPRENDSGNASSHKVHSTLTLAKPVADSALQRNDYLCLDNDVAKSQDNITGSLSNDDNNIVMLSQEPV